MAKVRKIPAAFEGTRAIPAQYTTDPDIATPEQIAAIGSATDKARRLAKGERIVKPMAQGAAIATAPTKINSTVRALLTAEAQAQRAAAKG